jgi:adenosylmethionine---8-amino-7-oxononanoate aminotransferase
MPNRSPTSASIPPWQRHGAPYVWMPYTQMKTAPWPLPVVRTAEAFLILDDGRRLIDGMASWWTACHGYNHPHLVQAVAEQLQQMPHVMFGGIHHPQALRLAGRLAELLPGPLNHVFFCDSGSVAVEVALKIAVQYGLNQGHRGRTKFVSFHHAYHGDTTGAMSVCDPDNSMHAHFKGYLLEHYSCPIPETAEQQAEFRRLLERHRAELAGVIIEPLVQGAGGMKFHSPEALAFVRRSCDDHGLPLIADEIATGFGRTGTMFACQQADVVPDLICLGKALSGGLLSFAATVATDAVYDAFLADDPTCCLMHGPTYMANPLACAAANASLDLFQQEPRLQQARQMEDVMRQALEPCRQFPGVVDVRCRGAVGVIQVAQLKQLDRLRQRFVEQGVWLRPFRDMIYLTPALNIAPEPLGELLETTVTVVREWSTW